MKNIGFLILHIDSSPAMKSLLLSIENIIDKDPNNHYVVFNSSIDSVLSNKVPVLHMDYAKYFDGDIWCFDIHGLQLNKALNNSRILFYATDTPWVTNYLHYKRWLGILYESDINIVVNSQELYDLYKICWREPLDIMENFSYEKIKKFI